MSSRDYGGIIWTNHALDRLTQRGLSQEWALGTFNHPDTAFAGKESGTNEYQKQYGTHRVTVIAKKNEQGQWIVLSCWMDPPLFGTEDYRKKQNYHAYKKSSGWKRIWIIIKQQLGL